MRTKTFNLGAAVNVSETVLKGRKRKLFFLSTSRILINRYRNAIGNGDVTFELNRDWFENRYQAKPVDYWGGDWKHASPPSERMSEKEERIFSESPYIRMARLKDAISAVYLYVNLKSFDKIRDSRHLRTILVESKRYGIPIHFFINRDDYYKGNVRKVVPLRQLISVLEIVKEDHYYRSQKDRTQEWRELFWKTSKKSLSEKAKKQAYNLVYRNYDVLRSLEADLHNNKNNPLEMRKMAMIWKKLKIETVKQYHDFLEEKWKAIYEAEQ